MHHKVFYNFECWQGEVEAGYTPNFLGVITREAFFSLFSQHPEKRFVVTDYPAINGEYFEWIDLLEAVIQAHEIFTMIELGAGWGRWIVNAAVALQKYNPIPCNLVGVEAESTHFQWMKLHFQDNGFNPNFHQLIHAAVAEKDGKVWFSMGRPYESYGQAIVSRLWWLRKLKRSLVKSSDKEGGFYVKKIKAVSLNTLLQPLGQVDLIDLDVQGAELIVLKAAAVQLNQKVKRVHVETHSHDIEAGLRTLFQNLNWHKLNDYPRGSKSDTPWGKIQFQGGVQTWINPRFL